MVGLQRVLGLVAPVLAHGLQVSKTAPTEADHLVQSVAGPLQSQLVDAAEKAAYDLHDGKLVILTSSNGAYSNLTLNLFLSMRKTHRSKLVVFCEDLACKTALEGRGMFIISTGNGFTAAGDYDTPDFNLITGRKPTYVQWFLQRGFTVLWTDSDVAWISDPVPSLERLSSSFIAQDDSSLRGEKAIPVTAPSLARKANTGFFWVQPDEVGKTLMAKWLLAMGEGNAKLQDQRVFQPVLRRNCRQVCAEEVEVCESSECLLLSRARCPNGTVRKWKWGKDAWVFHANWHNGVDRKVDQMLQKELWLLSTESLGK